MAVIIYCHKHCYRWLAQTFDVCVVVVNQVTGNFSPAYHSSRASSPALGLAWSHCINSRINLSRDSEMVRSIGQENSENDAAKRGLTSSRRMMSLELSPCHGSRSAFFIIEKSGLLGLKDCSWDFFIHIALTLMWFARACIFAYRYSFNNLMKTV